MDRAARREVALLRSASSEAWQYTGRAADQPPETMERLVRTMIGHDIAHLDQLYRTVRAVQAGAGRDVTSLDATYQSFSR